MGRHILVRHSLDTQTRPAHTREGRLQRLVAHMLVLWIGRTVVPLELALRSAPRVVEPFAVVVMVHRPSLVQRLGARLSYGT